MFRSLLPLENPIGFGASDFIVLALAALVILLLLAYVAAAPAARRLSERTGWCMLLLALLPVALRLALLGRYPVPTPAGSDDFSHLLVADTLRHWRLANPPHALHQFFEANFVLQQPSYASIYPIGQGLALALGWMLFGHPWAGVVLSVAALCSLCYWMLRGWVTPGWALAGALLAVFQFGPLTYWMNTYWGGAVSAAAGCLVFGALPRLRANGRGRYAAVLGAGLGLQLLARPYEFALLLLCVALYGVPAWRQWRQATRAGVMVVLALAPAAGLTLLQNRQVTGSWTTLPYRLSQYQYGVPASFTWQPNPAPHRELTLEQQMNYDAQVAIHGPATDTIRAYLARLAYRARFYRFFFPVPLYLALPVLLFCPRKRRLAWVLLVLLIFALGTNFYPYFYPHYIAAATCLFVLVGVAALERLDRFKFRGWPLGREVALLLVLLCAAQFLFWYGARAFGADVSRYENWDFINSGDPEGRIAIDQRLARLPGRQLVFVHYSSQHGFHEWIHNAADIDRSRVVWALDLGSSENDKLRHYYPDRAAWLLEPDRDPPKLSPYQPEPKGLVLLPVR